MKDHPAKAALFLAPNLFGFALFTLGPVLATALLSLFAWDLFGSPRFVGLEAYVDLLGFDLPPGVSPLVLGLLAGGVGSLATLFLRGRPAARRGHLWTGFLFFTAAVFTLFLYGAPRTPKFWQSLWNTFFLLLGLPVGMAGSLLLAVLLNGKVFGNRFFRMIFFLPSVVGGVGIYLLWKWIFSTEDGAVNYLILRLLGTAGPAWFESTTWAKPALMVMNLWGSIGGTNMILYLAALQSIDPGLYEAAQIDGASAWRRFWHVTVPMVSSTSVFILIMGIIHGFQGGFDAAYVMTRGGPAGATTTVNYLIYETAFSHFEMGSASAISVLLFFMVLGMSWASWKLSANKVHYT